MNRDDKYVVGDFAGLGRDQLLAINDDNGWSQLMSYNNSSSSWDTPWGNNGSGKLAWWDMHEDQYIAGDFAGLGFDQLLAVNYADGWAQLLEYYGGSWHTIWGNGGSHWISGWYLSAGEGTARDCDKRQRLRSSGAVFRWQLECRLGQQRQWQDPLVEHKSQTITWLAISTAATRINSWRLQRTERVDPTDGVFRLWLGHTLVERRRRHHSLWYMHPTDKYIAGDFNGHGQKDLFAVSVTGWAT